MHDAGMQRADPTTSAADVDGPTTPQTTPKTLDQLGRAGEASRTPQAGAARALPGHTGLLPPDTGPFPEARRALPARPGLWQRTMQWVVAAGVTVLLMWLTYSGGGWIPILSAADLVVHEAGHAVTSWAPWLVCSFAGSFFQVAVPLALTGYFWWRKDRFAVIVLLAWAAENLNNVSVYVGDAQRMVLPLVGDDGSGAGHDWHNILSALGMLGSTDALANAVRTASVCLFVVALGMAALGFYRARQEDWPGTSGGGE